MILQFTEYVNSLSVTIAAGVAIYGIHSWRREQVGKRRIEIAEETLALFYEARDVINGARTSISSEGEWLAAQRTLSDATVKNSEPTEVTIVAYRLYCRNELFARIRALRYRFSAIFGIGTDQPFREMVRIRDSVISAERRLQRIERTESSNTNERNANCESEIEKLLAVVEGSGENSDLIAQQLDQVVDSIECTCRKYMDADIPLA
jgi:hypothetical protein